MMLVARVLLKKTKPFDFTASLAAAAASSSSSSSLLCNPQQHGITTSRSFAILSSPDSYASPSSFNNNLKSNNLQLSAFSLSRSFSDSKPNEKENENEKPTATANDHQDDAPAKPRPKPTAAAAAAAANDHQDDARAKPRPKPTAAAAAANHHQDARAKPRSRPRPKPKPTAAPLSEDGDDSSGDDEDISIQDLIKLVSEKDQLLDAKHKEIQDMKDKVLRTFADMENLLDRTRRQTDNSKKFAIQNFAIDLLDVADNLGRASSVVKQSFAKIDQSNDSAGAVPLLKTLLEGVDMTNKQLGEVFKKFGVEKYDPLEEQFDPHRHNAVFQVPDASKPPGTVAVVLKSGYMLHDRIIRPAEVGVTQAVESNEAEQGSET